MIKRKQWDLYRMVDNILPAFFVIAFVEFYFEIWRLSALVKLASIVLTFLIFVKTLNQPNVVFKYIMIGFIVFNLLTIIAYLYNGRPIGGYLDDILNYIPAMLYVFVGMTDKRESREYYDKFLKYCAISMSIGLFLYVMTPDWYVARQVEIINRAWFNEWTFSEENVMEALRFTSYLASEYAVMFNCMFALSVALFNYYNKSKKRNYIFLFYVLLMFVTAIISQMRVAMAVSFMVIVFYFLRSYFVGMGKRSLLIVLLFAIVVITAISLILTKFGERSEQITKLMTERFEELSFSKALEGRDFQVSRLMNDFEFYFLGHGMGSGGSVIRSLGFNGVTDANYFKILFETGVAGFLFFVILISITLFQALKFYRYYMTEIVIIFFTLVSMLGANSLALSYLYILPFWYAVGNVWNKHYLNYAIRKNIKI